MSEYLINKDYRISYFKNEKKKGKPYIDKEYDDDLKNYEDFEIITKKYINSKSNIFNKKS